MLHCCEPVVQAKEAPKEAEAGEDKGGDGSGGDASDGPAGDGEGAAAAEPGAGEGADGGDEGVVDGGAGRDSAATAPPASRDTYLLQPDDLKGEELAARTGQLDIMLEYLWQVGSPSSHTASLASLIAVAHSACALLLFH